MKKNKNNVYAVRIPEGHPFWDEKDKKQVILDALEIYYATKAVLSGAIKLESMQEISPPQQQAGLGLDKKSVKSFLDAFSKL